MDPDSIRSVDPDPGEQKLPTKIDLKNFRAEGFSCSLDVLYGGLGIRKLSFLIFEQEIFLKVLVIKTLDPDPDRCSA